MVLDADILVRRAREALATPDPAQAVADLLREAITAEPAALRRALRDGDPSSQPIAALGMRVLVDSAELTMFHTSLPPGFVNAPHDHRTWAVVAVYKLSLIHI